MEGGLLLLGDPCHEPIPVQQVSDQGQERISLAAGAIIGAECFWKGSDAKARIFRAASLSHASGQMQPEVMSRQAVLWDPTC